MRSQYISGSNIKGLKNTVENIRQVCHNDFFRLLAH